MVLELILMVSRNVQDALLDLEAQNHPHLNQKKIILTVTTVKMILPSRCVIMVALVQKLGIGDTKRVNSWAFSFQEIGKKELCNSSLKSLESC